MNATMDLQTNVTAKRQLDSEANETHIDGYGGNVRQHARWPFL
jgi:hypothetical protein